MDLGTCLTFRILARSKHYSVFQQMYTCFLLGNLHELATMTTISFSLFLHRPGHIINFGSQIFDSRSLCKSLDCESEFICLLLPYQFPVQMSQCMHMCVYTHTHENNSQLNKISRKIWMTRVCCSNYLQVTPYVIQECCR